MPSAQHVAQSTVIRVINIAKKLRNFGFEYDINFIDVQSLDANVKAIKKADIVFFHKIQANKYTIIEPTYLPLFMLSKLCNKKIVFDFDDSIFRTFPVLFETLVYGSDMVFAGSHFLYDYASKLNNSTYLIPSAVNTDIFKPINMSTKNDNVVIGWHGYVHGHKANLKLLMPILRKLGKHYDITFKLLGTKGNKFYQELFKKQFPNVKIDFGPDKWVPYEEVPSLLKEVDIAVSPLENNIWNKGKCAMKLLEYMSLGLPVVASNVGEHRYIIKNSYNGFLASSTEEWVEFLSMLIDDTSLRREMGTNARKFIEKYYSLDNISLKIKNLIEKSLQVD